jgi:hypothetical protein
MPVQRRISLPQDRPNIPVLTFPFLIFFAGQKEENFDTLVVQRPLTNSINVTFNIGYNISPRWYAGFNIDVIGFTFGRKSSAVFTGINASTGEQGTFTEPESIPASFNLLLTGDHDLGSLNLNSSLSGIGEGGI